MPVARSLSINYTFDEKVYWNQYQQEYLFGGQLLVAPVSCDQQFARVYLPAGGWYRLGSDEFHKGETEPIVRAPLDDLPVFARESAIIPLQSPVQYSGQKPSPALELHIYKGEFPNSFIFYEDDGITYKYEKGEFCKRVIRYDPAGKSIILSACEGSFPSKYTTLMLVLHGFGDLMAIRINGEDKMLKLKSATARSAGFPLSENEIVIKY